MEPCPPPQKKTNHPETSSKAEPDPTQVELVPGLPGWMLRLDGAVSRQTTSGLPASQDGTTPEAESRLWFRLDLQCPTLSEDAARYS